MPTVAPLPVPRPGGASSGISRPDASRDPQPQASSPRAGETFPQPQPDHAAGRLGESFGAEAARYERTRPAYPDAMIEAIVGSLPGPEVLDAGIGTGIAARQLAAAGCHVTGLDPDERMAEVARRSGFEVVTSRLEEWDGAGRLFDGISAGQSWHWIDPEAGARQAARLLRPGGRLAAFWNVFLPAADLAREFAGAYEEVMPGSRLNPWARPGLESFAAVFGKVAGGIGQAGAFGEVEQWRFDFSRTYTREQWLDQVPTFGGGAGLPGDLMARLLARLAAIIDARGGSFEMPYAAVVVTAARR